MLTMVRNSGDSSGKRSNSGRSGDGRVLTGVQSNDNTVDKGHTKTFTRQRKLAVVVRQSRWLDSMRCKTRQVVRH